MKVFISWSGKRSKQVAELFKTWLKLVLQASDPWISSQDLQNGSWWFNEINNQLAETTIGIVCLTQENKNKPWILFETGAMAKGLSTNRVCPFLIDLEAKDVENPLAYLNLTNSDQDGVWSLVRTINTMLTDPLSQEILTAVFKKYWPDFEFQFKAILAETENNTPVEPRKEEDILTEILLTIRGLDNRVKMVESTNIFREPMRRAVNGEPISKDLTKLISSIKQYLRYDYYNFREFPGKDQTVSAMSQNYEFPLAMIAKLYDEEYELALREAESGSLHINEKPLKR